VFLPWSGFWDHNVLLEWSTAIHDATRSSYVRGGISGLGLVNLWMGVLEAFDAWQRHEPAGTSVLSAFDEVRRGRA
jgi:uncharacterized iron-regulated membrane protein